MRSDPSVSFVVISKNDRGLAETLDALRDLGHQAAETIVVDASRHKLDDIRDAHPEARWLVFEPQPKPTIPEQRNVGVAAAAHDVIVFIDASCVPAADWLERLLAPIASGEETIVAGAHASGRPDSLRDAATARLQGTRHVTEAPTINLAVRRTLFDTVGGFDERFHYGSDVDWTWRAVAAGHRIRYAPDAVVVHDWGDTRQELRRSWLYGQARLRLHLKHGSHRRDLIGSDLPLLLYPPFLLALPLLLLRAPRAALGLVSLSLWRNRAHRPALTLVHHLVYAAGALRAAAESLRTWR